MTKKLIPPFYYIEFCETALRCCLYENSKVRYRTILPLHKHEYYEATIYNQQALSNAIASFITDHPIEHAHAIVAIPDYAACAEGHRPFLILQMALCVTHAGCMISSLIARPLSHPDTQKICMPQESENLYNLFSRPANLSPVSWLLKTGIAIAGIIAIIIVVQKTTLRSKNELLANLAELEPLRIQRRQGEERITELKKEIARFNLLSKKFTQYEHASNRPHKLLKALSDSIPPSSWLEHVTLQKRPSSLYAVELEGYAPSLSEVSSFMNKLSKSEDLAAFHLTGFAVDPINPSQYHFKLSGSMLN